LKNRHWRGYTLLFVGVATSRADFLEPYKGETLDTLLRVTSNCLPVEDGTGEQKNVGTPFRIRIIHFIFIIIILIRIVLH
jgi:hypothetical protein